MQPTAILDLDGTLVDSRMDIQTALNRLMIRRGLAAFSLDEVTSFIGDGVPRLLQRAFAAHEESPDDAALSDFMSDYEANAVVHTQLFPGMADVLDQLASRGWSMAVCTNKPKQAALMVLDRLGITHRFAAVGGGDSFPARKPDPAHVLATLHAAGGNAEAAVMVGDHHNDVAAGRAAGLPVIFCGWGYGAAEMADGAPVAHRPAALPDLLSAALRRSG